ncbi:MAG: hypothetical protein QM758_03890 [Armatimonas sp.]
MTDEELETRLALLALLPAGSPELERVRQTFLLILMQTRPMEAVEYAWEWWGRPRGVKTMPQMFLPEQALYQLPGIRDRQGSALTESWLMAMLAEDTCNSAWITAPLASLAPVGWPVEALLERATRHPVLELLKALAPLCLMPEMAGERQVRLLRLLASHPEHLRALSEHLGKEAIQFPLAHSRQFVTTARQVLGQTATARLLVRGVRETRLVLRLRIRRRCRNRWAPRVDRWLATQPQTRFYQALRQEIAYFPQIAIR